MSHISDKDPVARVSKMQYPVEINWHIRFNSFSYPNYYHTLSQLADCYRCD
jgi:hypothetical protein